MLYFLLIVGLRLWSLVRSDHRVGKILTIRLANDRAKGQEEIGERELVHLSFSSFGVLSGFVNSLVGAQLHPKEKTVISCSKLPP